MSTRIKFDKLPEFVKPKLEDFDIETVSFDLLTGVLDISKLPNDEILADLGSTNSGNTKNDKKGYKWSSWGLSLSVDNIKGMTTNLTNFLKYLDTVQQVAIVVLKLMRVFSNDLKSLSRLIKGLVKEIVKKIKEIIDGFASTGMYMSVVFPAFDPRDSKYVMPINGGYQEFISAVNARCLASSDPDAPRFQKNDVVGGLILAMVGGNNDPQFLDDVVKNFRILSRFFKFPEILPAPANKVVASPGFYKDDKGILKLGVKISWEHPGTPVTGFDLYRSKSPKGIKYQAEVDGQKAEYTRFKDDTFNKGYPVKTAVIIDRPKYSYVDFEVEDNVTYYYKVYSTVGYNFIENLPFLSRLESPVSSPIVSATPRKCIPVSELKKYVTLDVDGQPVDADDFGGDWQSFSVRTLLGSEIGTVFNLLDQLSDKISGMLSSATDNADDYLKLYEKKIKFYMDILNKISDMISRLLSFKMSGTFMLLELFPEKGGMEYFVERFNNASKTEEVTTIEGVGKKGVKTGSGPSFSSYTDKGVMFGIILLYGFPSPGGEYLKEFEVITEGSKPLLISSLDQSKIAIDNFLKILGLGG